MSVRSISADTLDGIRKVGSDFSFSNTLLSNVNNTYFIERMLNSSTQSTFQDGNLVQVLSAIGDQVGSRVYEEILNYIDNVGNADVCKIKSLQSMANILGISYTAFAVINDMPLEIQHIMDIMSISPTYLLQSEKVCSVLTSYVYSNATSSIAPETQQIVSNQLSGLSQAYAYDDNVSNDISASVPNYIDIKMLDDATSAIYAVQLSSVLLSSYYDYRLDGSPVLSTNIMSSNVPDYRTYNTYINNEHQIILRPEEYDEKIGRLKKYYNLPFFNEVKAANDVNTGISAIDDYTTYEQQIIDVELQYRAKAFDASSPLSRYAYYKADLVQQYIDFVESMYSANKLEQLEFYNLDPDYVLLKKNIAAQLLSASNDSGDNLSVDYSMIDSAAQQLAIITQYIRDLRSKIKSQAQKNSMKGTFIFLNYIVNEYLKENITTNQQYFVDTLDPTTAGADVQLVEYVDPTNYFNISTDVDTSATSYLDGQVSSLSGTLNHRYWENEGSVPVVVSPDSTNIFAGPNIVQSKSTAFSEEAISAFYIDVLNDLLGDTTLSNDISSNISHLASFLCAVFDTGADRTYKDADGNLCCFMNMDEYYSRLSDIQQQIADASSSVTTNISIRQEKLDEDIAASQTSVDSDLSRVDSETNEQMQNALLSAQMDVNALYAEYDVGTLSTHFTIDITNFSQDQIDALSTYTLSTLSAQRYVSLMAEQTVLQNKYAKQKADLLESLNAKKSELSSSFESYKAEQLKSVDDLSIDLYKGLEEFRQASTADISAYKAELYYRYSGLSAQELPFYNYPNKVHPSYQIHPYLSSFIETYDYSYIIENMPVLAEQTMFQLLSKNIEQYIDPEGYLLSVWNNPLNKNSDYLTHYERVSHIDNSNKVNCLYGYDGLFYPTAANELLETVYAAANKQQAIKEFIDKWYSGLNVSDTQKERIADQLSNFEDYISAACTKCYDIYRYGKDIYGNMYILLKDYGIQNVDAQAMQNVSEEKKRSTEGSLWLRLKNHPIAFPAYALSNLSSLSQVDYNIDTSNTLLFNSSFAIEGDDILDGNIPPIYDFFLSKDRQQIEMYTKVKENGQEHNAVLIAAILQEYNYNNDIDRYMLFLNTVRQRNSSKTERALLSSNEYFVDFINYEYNIGYISMLSSLGTEEGRINVTARQTMFNDPDVESAVDDKIECKDIIKDFNNQLSDIKVDSCNEKMYFSYISGYTDGQINTYFNNTTKADTTYQSLSNTTIDIFVDNMVIVQQAEVSKSMIRPSGKKKCYLPFTNMGFLPLVSQEMLSDDLYSDMTNSTLELMEKYHIVKMQPVSMSNNGFDKGIQYIYCLPYARIYEDVKNEVSALSDINNVYLESAFKDLKVYSYNQLHGFEESYKDFESRLYEPYAIRDFLNTLPDDQNVEIKVDEEFNNVAAIRSSPYLTQTIPWLISGEIPSSVEFPGADGQPSASISNTSSFKLVKSDSYPISVCWFIYGEENNQIKLDFNTKYYNKQINENLKNSYNYQHTFLNLDYPGAAGYLKIYNSNISNATKPENFDDPRYYDNVYYIKNISDNKPKFLISAMNYIEPDVDVALLNYGDLSVVEGTIECTPLLLDEPYVEEDEKYIQVLNINDLNAAEEQENDNE